MMAELLTVHGVSTCRCKDSIVIVKEDIPRNEVTDWRNCSFRSALNHYHISDLKDFVSITIDNGVEVTFTELQNYQITRELGHDERISLIQDIYNANKRAVTQQEEE